MPVSILPEELLDRHQVRRALNVSLATIDRAIARGELPVVRFGRSVRVRPSILSSIIEAGGFSSPEAR